MKQRSVRCVKHSTRTNRNSFANSRPLQRRSWESVTPCSSMERVMGIEPTTFGLGIEPGTSGQSRTTEKPNDSGGHSATPVASGQPETAPDGPSAPVSAPVGSSSRQRRRTP